MKAVSTMRLVIAVFVVDTRVSIPITNQRRVVSSPLPERSSTTVIKRSQQHLCTSCVSLVSL